MSRKISTRKYRLTYAASIAMTALLALVAFAAPAGAAGRASVLENLLGRAQVENRIADYYSCLRPGCHDMGSFYAPDGVLDVNGMIAKGHNAIDALYKLVAKHEHLPKGKFNLLITNLHVIVHGDTARAQDIWTGVSSATPESTPRFVEQGHEDDVFVKLHGHWYLKHRVITSDGGMPKMFEKTRHRASRRGH